MQKSNKPHFTEIIDLLERIKIGTTVKEHDERDQRILNFLIKEYSKNKKK